MMPASMKEKADAVKMSIYAQTGLIHRNLRRHESAPKTDIDDLLDNKALAHQHTMEQPIGIIQYPTNEHGVIPYHLLDDE